MDVINVFQTALRQEPSEHDCGAHVEDFAQKFGQPEHPETGIGNHKSQKTSSSNLRNYLA